MEILERLRIFRSRWVVGVLILGLAFAALGYTLRSRLPPVYQATARLLVGSYLQDARPTSQDIQIANELTKTYAQLINTSALRQDALRVLDLDVDLDRINLMTLEPLGLTVKVSMGADIPFIDIVVSGSKPDLVAKMSNSLAEQVVMRSPGTPSIQERSQETSIQDQIVDLKAQRDKNNSLIVDADRRAQDAYEFNVIQNIRAERQTLLNNNIQISNIISNLETTLATIRSRTNTVEIIEPAHVPTNATATSPVIVLSLGFIVGAMLGSGVLLLTDDLFPRLNSPERVKRLSGLTLLGRIPKTQLSREPSPNWLVTRKQPMSASSEVYQRVYTHLYQPESQNVPVYIISSVRRGEGKSLVAANLAVTLASAGHKVLIVDANLRQPVLHKIFEVDETIDGLSCLLASSPDDLTALTGDELTDFFKKCIQESNIADVYVLPRGKLENDERGASLTLRLPHIAQWLTPLSARFGIDIFIFDTAAASVSSEALLLAECLEGQTVLVMETRQTLRSQAQEIVDQFLHKRAQLAGAVLNKQ